MIGRGGNCKTSHIPTSSNEWAPEATSYGFGGATWINSGAKKTFLTPINHHNFNFKDMC